MDAWLDPATTDPAKVSRILAGVQPPLLALRAVSRDVNKVGNDSPDLIDPIEPEEKPLQLVAA